MTQIEHGIGWRRQPERQHMDRIEAAVPVEDRINKQQRIGSVGYAGALYLTEATPAAFGGSWPPEWYTDMDGEDNSVT